MTTDHPLGTPHDPAADKPTVTEPSIVDTILNLDAFLSGDVRRAERTARFATRPDLQADIEDLEAQLSAATDARGNPEPTRPAGGPDRALGDGGEPTHPSLALAEQIQALRAEYAASFRSVRMRAMSDDDWTAFQERWRKVLQGEPPYAREMWDDLVVRSAVAPAINADQVRQLRSMVGPTAMLDLQGKAWDANTASGVSVPKSPLSSHVLRQARPAGN